MAKMAVNWQRQVPAKVEGKVGRVKTATDMFLFGVWQIMILVLAAAFAVYWTGKQVK